MTVSSAVLYQFACSSLTEETNARWQIGSHPFVTTGDDEIGGFNALVERDMTERLGSVNEAESYFTSFADSVHYLSNWQADAQVIDRWQEEPVALVFFKSRCEMTGNVVRSPTSVEDLVTNRNNRDSIPGAFCFGCYGLLVGGPTEVRGQHVTTDAKHATCSEMNKGNRAAGQQHLPIVWGSCELAKRLLQPRNAVPRMEARKAMLITRGPGIEAMTQKLFKVQAGGFFGRKSNEVNLCIFGGR
jgi:hypothetical protein